jgi:hypothetical protein
MIPLAPIQLEDGIIIYLEATEDINVSPISSKEKTRISKGGLPPSSIANNFEAVERTIRAYTSFALNAFKKVSIANIDKVTLEFGIKIGAEGNIPFVTKGTAESNLKITVECSFQSHHPN